MGRFLPPGSINEFRIELTGLAEVARVHPLWERSGMAEPVAVVKRYRHEHPHRTDHVELMGLQARMLQCSHWPSPAPTPLRYLCQLAGAQWPQPIEIRWMQV